MSGAPAFIDFNNQWGNNRSVPVDYEGQWLAWYRNGSKHYEENYKNGKRNGFSPVWYENGDVKAELNYIEGKMDGLQSFWYLNRRKIMTRIYNNGVSVSSVFWDKNGVINKKELFDPKGNPLKVEVFEKGKLVRTEVGE